MSKPFWTKKIWPGWQGGSGKVKIWHIWVISMGNVQKCTILTFPDPPCQPGQNFLVQNGFYMCPTYSTTCFMWNSPLGGYFRPSEVRFMGILALLGDLFYIYIIFKLDFRIIIIFSWCMFLLHVGGGQQGGGDGRRSSIKPSILSLYWTHLSESQWKQGRLGLAGWISNDLYKLEGYWT